MNTNILKIALLVLITSQTLARIVEPHSKHRIVHLEDSFKKLVDYVKSGAHSVYHNSLEFLENHQDNSIGRCGPDIEVHPFKFLGYTTAQLKENTAKSQSWSNHCFQSNWASFQWTGAMEATVVIHSEKPKFPGCSDTYSITDIYNFDLKVVEAEGDHTIVYKFAHQKEVDLVKLNGLKIVRLCDSHVNLLPDFAITAMMFMRDPLVEDERGEKTPPEIRNMIYQYHYHWLEKWEGLELVKRDIKKPIDADWMRKNAKSGDVLCRFEGTGLSSLVMWGTGGPCSHMLMFMWGRGDQEGQLMVLQSNGKGVWRQPVDDFWKENDGTSISMFPLSPESRQKWDFNKAWDWFETMEGQPYGYAIFLFGFLDTPEDNFPQVTDSNSWGTFISMLNSVPEIGPQAINKI